MYALHRSLCSLQWYHSGRSPLRHVPCSIVPVPAVASRSTNWACRDLSQRRIPDVRSNCRHQRMQRPCTYVWSHSVPAPWCRMLASSKIFQSTTHACPLPSCDAKTCSDDWTLLHQRLLDLYEHYEYRVTAVQLRSGFLYWRLSPTIWTLILLVEAPTAPSEWNYRFCTVKI